MDKNWHFKKYGLLWEHARSWRINQLGYDDWGKGDVGSRSGTGALIYADKEMLNAAMQLLRDRRRWPIQLDHPNDAKNRIDFYWDKLWYQEGDFMKNRWVTGMTRDPYTFILSAWYKMEGRIPEDLSYPKYLYRPDFHYWFRYLQTEKEEYRDKYIRWALFTIRNFKVPMYGYMLAATKAWTIDAWEVSAAIVMTGNIPQWNLGMWELLGIDCGVPWYEYRAKYGFQWAKDERMEEDKWFYDGWYLQETDQYKPDQDFLRFLQGERYPIPDIRN